MKKAIMVFIFLLFLSIPASAQTFPRVNEYGWTETVTDQDCGTLPYTGSPHCGGDPDFEQCHFYFEDEEVIVHNGNQGNGGRCWLSREIDLRNYASVNDITHIGFFADSYTEHVGGTCYIRTGIGAFKNIGCPYKENELGAHEYKINECTETNWHHTHYVDFTERWIEEGRPSKVNLGIWATSCSTYFSKIHVRNLHLSIHSSGDVRYVYLTPPTGNVRHVNPNQDTSQYIPSSASNRTMQEQERNDVFAPVTSFFSNLWRYLNNPI